MSNQVLKVENLSKLYRLGEVGTGTLSHDLNRWWAKTRGKEDPYAKIGQVNDRSSAAQSEYVWALKDVSFEVKRGDVLGIVGRNGAGKSTLLKLLSQITSITSGEIKAKGRIAALLEVGTGMHPEMTARENIYLNGAILGMSKKEISSKFEEIVDFSGCRMYVDTPIKRYSSGMRVRLGFAVAAFLEPEILIIDEVLAVGDAEFQRKAIGKMRDISKEGGRTILFVSHNMAAVKSLCTRAFLLENGMITKSGGTDEVVSYYLGGDMDATSVRNFEPSPIEKNSFKLLSFGVKAKGGAYNEPITRDKEIQFVVEYENNSVLPIDFTIKFKGDDGEYIMVTSTIEYSDKVKSGRGKTVMTTPAKFFNDGVFFLDLLVVENKSKAIIKEADILKFTVNPDPKPLGTWMGKEAGFFMPDFKWEVE